MYQSLKSSLKQEDSIYFADSVHPSQATKLSYGWIRRGKNKDINTTASRTRLNIIGALNLEDIEGTIFARYETINADSIIRHMRLLRNKKGEESLNLVSHA